MHLFTLIYDMLLLSLYVMAFSVAFSAYCVRKSGKWKTCGILFAIFALDHLVISLTELDTGFSFAYDTTFLMVPSWKTLIYAGTFLCMLYLLRQTFGDKTRTSLKVLAVLLIFMFVALLFIPLLPNSALKSWLYFFPSQLYLFIFSVIALIQAKKAPDTVIVRRIPLLKSTWKITLVFSILIVIEDTYVIFFQDVYTNPVNIQMRSYTEDIMRVFMAVISLVETTWFLRQKDSVPSDAAITENAPADDEIPQNQPLEKAPDEPLEQFAETYFFTDREKEIFGMLLKNMSNQEISEALSISLGTAKTHTHNIFSKMNAAGRREAIRTFQDFAKDIPQT